MTFSNILSWFAGAWSWIIGGVRLLFRLGTGHFRFLFSGLFTLATALGTGYVFVNFLRVGSSYWSAWIDGLRNIAEGSALSTLPGAGALHGLALNLFWLLRMDYLAAGIVVLLTLMMAMVVWRLTRMLRGAK